jgi:hypothetical protein
MEFLKAPVIQILLWGTAVLAGVWVFVPAVAFAIRPVRFRDKPRADPDAPEPRALDPFYLRAVRAFAEMGFRPAGRIAASVWFPSPVLWRSGSEGPAWMASDGKIIASMYYLRDQRSWATAATTLFAGGGYLETVSRSPKAGWTLPAGDQRRVELDDVEPVELIAEHQRQVEDFARERGAPAKEATFAEAVDGMMTFNNQNFPRGRLWKTDGVFWNYVFLGIFGLELFVMLRTFAKFGWMSSFRPLALCAVAGGALLVTRVRVPKRIARLVGCAVLLVGVLTPMMLSSWIENRAIGDLFGAFDRLEADVVSGHTVEGIDRTADLGPTACGAALQRYADPRTAPDTRQALHAILVRWNGGDLGDQPAAWASWCDHGVLGLK